MSDVIPAPLARGKRIRRRGSTQASACMDRRLAAVSLHLKHARMPGPCTAGVHDATLLDSDPCYYRPTIDCVDALDHLSAAEIRALRKGRSRRNDWCTRGLCPDLRTSTREVVLVASKAASSWSRLWVRASTRCSATAPSPRAVQCGRLSRSRAPDPLALGERPRDDVGRTKGQAGIRSCLKTAGTISKRYDNDISNCLALGAVLGHGRARGFADAGGGSGPQVVDAWAL